MRTSYEEGTLGWMLRLPYRAPDGKAATMEELAEKAFRMFTDGFTTGEREQWLAEYRVVKIGRNDGHQICDSNRR